MLAKTWKQKYADPDFFGRGRRRVKTLQTQVQERSALCAYTHVRT